LLRLIQTKQLKQLNQCYKTKKISKLLIFFYSALSDTAFDASRRILSDIAA